MNLLLISYFCCVVVGEPQDFTICVRFKMTRYVFSYSLMEVLALEDRELQLASMQSIRAF